MTKHSDRDYTLLAILVTWALFAISTFYQNMSPKPVQPIVIHPVSPKVEPEGVPKCPDLDKCPRRKGKPCQVHLL